MCPLFGPHRKKCAKSKNAALLCKLANIKKNKKICVIRIENQTKGKLKWHTQTNFKASDGQLLVYKKHIWNIIPLRLS